MYSGFSLDLLYMIFVSCVVGFCIHFAAGEARERELPRADLLGSISKRSKLGGHVAQLHKVA